MMDAKFRNEEKQNALAFARATERNPHLKEYVEAFVREHKVKPEFHVQLSKELQDLKYLNLIYPVGDPIFIHIHKDEKELEPKYIAIEPQFSSALREKYFAVLDKMLEAIPRQIEPKDSREFKLMIDQMLGGICFIGEWNRRFIDRIIKTPDQDKVFVTPREFDELRYKIMKDLAGLGILEPFIRDHHIEDIHCVGIGNIFLVHRIFKLIETNVSIFYDRDLDYYCYKFSEFLDKPVSRSRPIVDGILPDGSRINIIYGRDVSRKGSSFTIRKFTATPLSITQLIAWKTFSPQIAAYLWLCLENGMSAFICGETASGKTTTLNAIAVFIDSDAKIISAEDTPEINVPHENWQQLITRATLTKERRMAESRVEMADLLKAALRSRPDYLIVGEIRGKEGTIAFQAIQAGNPVLSTFHASSIRRMIQRFTGDPINVPQETIDNLNVALFQQALYQEGKLIRRTTNITEIEGYSAEAKGIITRKVFDWNPRTDVHIFEGTYNSYVLEEKVARALGYAEVKEIYDELELRTKILEEMVKKGIFDYHEVFEIIKTYREGGLEKLPFPVEV